MGIKQDKLKKYETPSLKCKDIDAKYRDLYDQCNKIMMTPKPKPKEPTPPPPKQEESNGHKKEDEKKEDDEEKKEDKKDDEEMTEKKEKEKKDENQKDGVEKMEVE